MRLSTKVMTLAHFGLTTPMLPGVILDPSCSGQWWHFPTSVLWHHMSPQCFLSPRLYHFPPPLPISTHLVPSSSHAFSALFSASTAIHGLAHAAHGSLLSHGEEHNSPLCSCPRSFCSRTHRRGGNGAVSGISCCCRSMTHPTPPVQCLCAQGHISTYRKAWKINATQSHIFF